jgi:hypothetical protein
MKIEYRYEHEKDKMTNFALAQAIIDVCDEGYNIEGLDAEVVAKMVLLQIDAWKGGEG